MLLWLAGPGAIAPALALFVAANIAYSVGENLIASFLPEIARPEDMGKVSGFGWAWGYLGGLVSLGLCFPLVAPGFTVGNAANLRLTNVVTGAFFLLAGLPTILFLRERARPRPLPGGRGYIGHGFAEVLQSLRHVGHFRELAKFLVVFLLFNCGIVIVVSFASIFAERTLGFGPLELVAFFLVVQVSAALGAFVFGFVQDKLGARRTIVLTLSIWLLVTLGCYFIESKALFYIVGNVAGLAIGSSQSASRAPVGVLAPPSRSAEFFGFWGLFWKLSSAIGPLFFGLASWASGSQRVAILVTGAFFLLGIAGMLFVDEPAGRRAAEAYDARLREEGAPADA
jgi:UMF1 family MFS transporter